MQGISKSFGPIKALEDVTLHVLKGTVHALVGENSRRQIHFDEDPLGVLRTDTGNIVREGETPRRGSILPTPSRPGLR